NSNYMYAIDDNSNLYQWDINNNINNQILSKKNQQLTITNIISKNESNESKNTNNESEDNEEVEEVEEVEVEEEEAEEEEENTFNDNSDPLDNDEDNDDDCIDRSLPVSNEQ